MCGASTLGVLCSSVDTFLQRRFWWNNLQKLKFESFTHRTCVSIQYTNEIEVHFHSGAIVIGMVYCFVIVCTALCREDGVWSTGWNVGSIQCAPWPISNLAILFAWLCIAIVWNNKLQCSDAWPPCCALHGSIFVRQRTQCDTHTHTRAHQTDHVILSSRRT